MSDPFFDRPILNSPYEYPSRHWELDQADQPTQKVIERRRGAKFVTRIPKPKKRKAPAQSGFVFDEGKGRSSETQQYDPTSLINEVRGHVDAWRSLPNPNQWQVTSETARLLQYWLHHRFSGVRPFFCQAEAFETAIWLTEVARHFKNDKRLLDHLDTANRDANPELTRLALKLATGRCIKWTSCWNATIVGIEVKAAATVKFSNFARLRTLGEACKERFAYGVVLHDSAELVPFSDRLAATPLSSLWGLWR